MESVMVNLKGEDVVVLKRLLRNLKYIFPKNFWEIDPYRIRESLFGSRVENKRQNEGTEIFEDISDQIYPSQLNVQEDQIFNEEKGKDNEEEEKKDENPDEEKVEQKEES